MISWTQEPQNYNLAGSTSVTQIQTFVFPGPATPLFFATQLTTRFTTKNKFGETVSGSSITQAGNEYYGPNKTETFSEIVQFTSPLQTSTTQTQTVAVESTQSQTVTTTVWTAETAQNAQSSYVTFFATTTTATQLTVAASTATVTIDTVTTNGTTRLLSYADTIYQAFTSYAHEAQSADVLAVFANDYANDKQTGFVTQTRTTVACSAFTSATALQSAGATAGVTQNETFLTTSATSLVSTTIAANTSQQGQYKTGVVPSEESTVAAGGYEALFQFFEPTIVPIVRSSALSAMPGRYVFEAESKTVSVSHLSATLSFVTDEEQQTVSSQISLSGDSSTALFGNFSVVGGKFYEGESISYTIPSGAYSVEEVGASTTSFVQQSTSVSYVGPVVLQTSKYVPITFLSTYTTEVSTWPASIVAVEPRNSIAVP